MGVELFHADRRTDNKKLIVAFRKLANVPKMNMKHEMRDYTGNNWSHQNSNKRYK